MTAEWGISADAPASVQEYARNELRPSPRQFDLAGDPESFGRYQLIVSLHARQIFPQEILDNSVCVNLHPGLPHQRGWVPYSWAIMTGEQATGCTLHRMSRRIDCGLIYDQQSVPILPTDTAGTVRQRIMDAERELFSQWFPHRIADLLQGKGDEFTTEAPLRTRAGWSELCQLNADDLAVIRKLRAATFQTDHSEAWFEADGTRYRVAIHIIQDET